VQTHRREEEKHTRRQTEKRRGETHTETNREEKRRRHGEQKEL
jgi:hypothetical protein